VEGGFNSSGKMWRELVDVTFFPKLQFNSYSCGTGICGIIGAVVIVAVSGNVSVWRFDICSNES
jgi:hypothetical protein